MGLAVSSAARSYGVPLSQYIDGRHVGQLLVQSSKQPWAPCSHQNAEKILCYLLLEASYFVNLSKSQCSPSTFVTFLGFTCDSIRQAFLIPEEKKVKFKVLRENILASKTVTLKILQRFAGKAVSFSLALAGCKLYFREIGKTVAGLVRNSKAAAKVTGLLQSELEYWRYLDDWTDCLPWRSERHIAVTFYCDASKRAWGGVLMTDNGRMEARDYWREESGSINFLEAKALLCALDAFSRIQNSRVDVHTDSRALLGSWQSEGGNNSKINDVINAILRCSQEFNFLIDIQYVPSAGNPGDAPSRRHSDLDCTLSEETWSRVQRMFGPHTFDLMPLDSNCRLDQLGNRRPHFTPCHNTLESSGINVFAHQLPIRENLDQHYQHPFMIIVPDIQPRRYWWALLQATSVDRFLPGRKGDDLVLFFPSAATPGWFPRPLQWDLWAFRCVC